MNKNAVLGALLTAVVGVIAYLLYSSGAIGNRSNSSSPFAQNGNFNNSQMMPQGQMQPGQQVQPAQQTQPVQQAQPAQKAPQKIAPSKAKSSPPPTAPAPLLLQTQDMAQLNALINSFGNPTAADQIRPCYIEIQQVDLNGNWKQIALVNEQCVVTPYAGGTITVTRKNGEAFFNLFGSPFSLIHYDEMTPDINLFQPRSPGLWFGNQVGMGSMPNCRIADNGMNSPLVITLCVS